MEDSVKNPYMEDFSHGKFVPAAQSLQVTERHDYQYEKNFYAFNPAFDNPKS